MMTKKALRYGGWAGLLALALAVPFIFTGRLSLVILMCLYAPVVAGLVLLCGYAGQVSLGHSAFIGIGAYASGILGVQYGWSPLITIPIAAAVSAMAGYLLSIPLLRLRTNYFILATLGLNVIFIVLAKQLRGLTGGPQGLMGIPPLEIGAFEIRGDFRYYYFALAVAAVVVWMSSNIARSGIGRELRMIEAGETGASTLGINRTSLGTKILVWSAALAGMSGALLAHWIGFISPDSFTIRMSVFYLLIAVIGGVKSVGGATTAVVLVVLFRELLRYGIPRLTDATATSYELVIFGLLLALVVVVAPHGLIAPILVRVGRWLRSGTGRAGVGGSESGSLLAADLDRVVQCSSSDGAKADDETPVVVVEDLVQRFGGLTAVDHFSLRLQCGEVLGLIGPNGAGKTTVINCMSGVIVPTAGRVIVRARDVTREPAHRKAALGMSRTFQTPRLIGDISVVDNVKLGTVLRHRQGLLAAAIMGHRLGAESESHSEGLAMVAALGLGDVADRPAGELPFGMQRMVEFGRSLLMRPAVLLLDEPASGLSPEERRDLSYLVSAVARNGMAVLLVEHNVDLVLALADRIAVIHNGAELATGSATEVWENPAVIDAYLGVTEEMSTRHRAVSAASAESRDPSSPSADAVPLRVRGLKAGHGSIAVLHGIDLTVGRGSVVGVYGRNGAGKSTLMNSIAGVLPSEGSIEIYGRSMKGRPTPDRVGMGLVLVPERRQLMPTMSVEANLVLGSYGLRHLPGYRAKTAMALKRVFELFPILEERQDQKAGSLSGGEQQMLAIGRALMSDPRILLLDEPLLGLAPKVIQEIIGTLSRLQEASSLTVIVVEQNLRALVSMCDEVLELKEGVLIRDESQLREQLSRGTHHATQENA